jgi:mannose-1-phosphate guanylyltransferase
MHTDDHDNAVDAERNIVIDSDGNIIVSRDGDEHLIALMGVSDMIVVHTKDATMVCPKTEAQRVKDLVMRVKDKFGERYM